MEAKARVLLVGVDPDIVDYSKSPVPGLTAAKVRAAVEGDKAKLETLGHSVTSLYVDDGKTAEAALTAELSTGEYDCIMIGAGLRIVPPYPVVREANQRRPPTRPSVNEGLLQYKPVRHGGRGAPLGLKELKVDLFSLEMLRRPFLLDGVIGQPCASQEAYADIHQRWRASRNAAAPS